MKHLLPQYRNALVRLPKFAANQSGLSLLELLISFVLGAALLGILGYLGFSISGNERLTDLQKLEQDGHTALNLITKHIRLAGHTPLRQNADPRMYSTNYTGLAVIGCDDGRPANVNSSTAASSLQDLVCRTTPISGGTSGRQFLTASSIAIAYEADSFNTIANRSRPNQPTDCTGASITNATSNGFLGTSYYLANNRFYVDGLGNLACTGNGVTNWISTPLRSGVEDMVIQYGLASQNTANTLGINTLTPRVGQYRSAKEMNLDSSLSNYAIERWANVVAVRICLIMRSEAKRAPQATPYTDCTGQVITPSASDRYFRLAVSTTVVLRNRLQMD